MENYEVDSLREWAPLTDVLEKLPARVQKGLFSQNLNVTCIDVVPEFIALGTDAGIVFWYNRFSGGIQKLRNETTSSITCVRIVSSVEFMVAAGNCSGQVNVFQIQKELPPDLNLVAPLTKAKPIERYTIRDLHKGPVTCCEWSKNGMKLFSGDKMGIVVLTEFDYQAHLCKSIELLNEAYDIVQLSLNQSYLLVSTTYRTIICVQDKTGKWQVLQVGKKDRKILSSFGATFLDKSSRSSKIICSRPGLRFWMADCDGNVHQTLLFKEAATKRPQWEIPLLNPAKNIPKSLLNFSRVFMYSKNFVITYDSATFYILNLEKLRLEASSQTFRGILDISVCGKEIFILEGPRSLIRISTSPEPPNKTAKIIFNPLMPPPLPAAATSSKSSLFDSPIEFEAEEEAVINAEECFELPPIEHIDLDIPFEINLDSPNTKHNKLLMEQSRRIEVFDRINDIPYEESILYRSAGKKHKKETNSVGRGPSSKKKFKSGIVEIGQAIEETSKSTDQIDSHNKKLELTTRPLIMDASFCTDNSLVPDLRSPDTLKRVLEPKEKALAESLNLEPVKLVEISEEDLKKSAIHHDLQLQNWQYPSLKYPITASVGDAEVQTTPRKKIHFINDDTEDAACCSTTTTTTKPQPTDYENLCDDMKNVMIQSDCSSSSSSNIQKSEINNKMTKSLQFVPGQLMMTPMSTINQQQQQPTTSSEMLPAIQRMPPHMKIPSIWNVTIEKVDDSEESDAQISGDWELVDP